MPLYNGNMDPESFAPRSISNMPNSFPISQCGTRWCCWYVRSSAGQRSFITLSSGPIPSGTSSAGILGIMSNRERTCSSARSAASSSAFSLSPASLELFISVSALALSPSRLASATCRESSFTKALVSSRLPDDSLACESKATNLSISSAGTPRRPSAAFNLSGFSRA